MIERYFDNAATTPLDPRVLAEMRPYLEEEFGNANSIHGWGQRARAGVELARSRVAALIGAADPMQIVFTSGATESCNWILAHYEGEAGWVSPFEHAAVLEPADRHGYEILANEGLELSPPDRDAVAALRPLVSVMSVNNEVGARWEVRDLTERVATHSDITQQVGKLPTDVEGLDYASFSAHKFYGPKGLGALYVDSDPPESMILGGEQENGLRSGTLNVPGIVGMGAAAAIAADQLGDDIAHALELRQIVLDGLRDTSDWVMNGSEDGSPYILSLSFLKVVGETLVVEVDRAGFAISSGSACSTGSNEPSTVLSALGIEPEWLQGTVRISFGRFNSKEAADSLSKSLRLAVENLRRMS